MAKATMVERREGATESGLHFWSLRGDCPRKFYLRHGLGITPTKTARALSFGGAFHDAKAKFYMVKKEPVRAMTKEFLDSLRSKRNDYENPDDYAMDAERGPILLNVWAETFGLNDKRVFKIVGVEKEIEAPLPNGFIVTGRLDAVIQDPQGLYYIMETKTTSFSVELVLQTLEMGDQVTTYYWLFKQAYPKLRLSGVIPDIAYWNKLAKGPESIRCFRGDIITRTSTDLHEFELYTMDELEDIARRMSAVATGKVAPIRAFGRRTNNCFSYHHRCEYANICRTELRRDRALPPEFFFSREERRKGGLVAGLHPQNRPLARKRTDVRKRRS